MTKALRSAAAILAAFLLITADARSAAMRSGIVPVQFRRGATMTTGGAVAPPGGFILYCLDFRAECAAGPQTPQLIDLTGVAMETLDSVQAAVDAAVRPRVNPNHVWAYPTDGYGDCNTYALEKKRELIARGLPRSALLLAVASTETNEGHLVLVARTNRGDLVLDNRVPRVLDWTRLPYRWIARQSECNPAMWLKIETEGRGGSAHLSAFDACRGPGIE